MAAAYERQYGAMVTIASGKKGQKAHAFADMIRAKLSHAANVKVVRVQQQLDQSLLDVYA